VDKTVTQNSIAVTVVQRLAYYDRNPLTASLSFIGSALGPHAQTTRATYTVPSTKKAMLTHATLLIERQVVATTVGQALNNTSVNGPTTFMAGIGTNTVGDRDMAAPGSQLVILAGQVVNALTSDVSTGGQVNYLIAVGIQEFDL
jgi:hypothetical protein